MFYYRWNNRSIIALGRRIETSRPTPELTAPRRRGTNNEPKPMGGCGRTPGWAADQKRAALALFFSLFYFNHLSINMLNTNDKIILDPCAGSRMFWFDKNNKNTIFADIRNESITVTDQSNGKTDGKRVININPGLQLDFRNLPFSDNSFKLVTFDPPHLIRCGKNSWLASKYGKLSKNWEDDIKKGFVECFRVLEPFGILIFKWNETDIKLNNILALTDITPLMGQQTGRGNKTFWLVFMKPNARIEGRGGED